MPDAVSERQDVLRGVAQGTRQGGMLRRAQGRPQSHTHTVPTPQRIFVLRYQCGTVRGVQVSRKEMRSKDDHFIVKHFAGDVVYFAGEFLDKNNDSLDAAAEGVLLSSSLPLVVTISTPEGGAAEPKKKKGGFQSVGRKVREHRAACPPST